MSFANNIYLLMMLTYCYTFQSCVLGDIKKIISIHPGKGEDKIKTKYNFAYNLHTQY